MALTARVQQHSAGDFDDSDGTIHSANKFAAAAAIARGQVITSDGANTGLRVAVATDIGPIYVANKGKALNGTYVDAMWGDDVIFYVIADGVIPIDSDLECGATGKLKAAAGTNQIVARYVKHGTKSNDPVTPLVAAADGDVIGVKLINKAQ